MAHTDLLAEHDKRLAKVQATFDAAQKAAVSRRAQAEAAADKAVRSAIADAEKAVSAAHAEYEAAVAKAQAAAEKAQAAEVDRFSKLTQTEGSD